MTFSLILLSLLLPKVQERIFYFLHHVKEDGAKLGICGHGLKRQQEEHRSNLTVASWHLLSAA